MTVAASRDRAVHAHEPCDAEAAALHALAAPSAVVRAEVFARRTGVSSVADALMPGAFPVPSAALRACLERRCLHVSHCVRDERSFFTGP